VDVQSIKDWFKNLPPQNIGLALLAILFIAFAGPKGLEIISNLTKDSSSSNPISKESSSSASKTPDLTSVNIIVRTKKGSQPLEDVTVQIISKGAPTDKTTDSNGYVEIQIPNRGSVEIILSKDGYRNKKQIINLATDPDTNKTLYIEPVQPQAPLNQSSMLVPSTPPSNSSPSPKPTQKNRVVFKEDFESNIASGNYISKHVVLTEGKKGKGLKVSYLDKSEERGVRSFQLPGVFEAGKTYQAGVWCKADKGAKCRIFFGDDTEANNTKPYENEVNGYGEGTGEWQQIITPSRKMSHAEYMSVYVYSEVLGTSATYDDILVEEVIN
jgi:hypothetical protein